MLMMYPAALLIGKLPKLWSSSRSSESRVVWLCRFVAERYNVTLNVVRDTGFELSSYKCTSEPEKEELTLAGRLIVVAY
jgi:hypothetical protein